MNTLTIRVMTTGADNIARVMGMGVKASATSSPGFAAERAARKVFFGKPFTLREVSRDECREVVYEARERPLPQEVMA